MGRVAMRDRLRIGQLWCRRRDKLIAAVRQIHRADRCVEMRAVVDGELTHFRVPFTELSKGWRELGV